MRRFTRRLLTRKISVPLWFVVFVMCTVIFTRKETETTRRLYEKQLNGSKNHKRNQLCDKCKEVKVGQLNPTFSIQYPNRTTPDKELRELTRKVEMYEKLNSLTEFHSWMSKFGSKRRQNVLIISDLRSGSAFLGELFNQHPRIFYLYEPLEALEFYRKNRPERIYDGMSRHLLRGIFHCNYFRAFLFYRLLVVSVQFVDSQNGQQIARLSAAVSRHKWQTALQYTHVHTTATADCFCALPPAQAHSYKNSGM